RLAVRALPQFSASSCPGPAGVGLRRVERRTVEVPDALPWPLPPAVRTRSRPMARGTEMLRHDFLKGRYVNGHLSVAILENRQASQKPTGLRCHPAPK